MFGKSLTTKEQMGQRAHYRSINAGNAGPKGKDDLQYSHNESALGTHRDQVALVIHRPG